MSALFCGSFQRLPRNTMMRFERSGTLIRETMDIQLEYFPNLADRIARVRDMALEIEHLPDNTQAPIGSSLADVEWSSLPEEVS